MSPISFAGLTGIANIIRDMIYMDGGQIWLQQYAIIIIIYEDIRAELTIHLRMFDDGCKNYTDGKKEIVESTFNQVKI